MPQLTWLGDADARRAARKVPYRILAPVETVGDAGAENLLIQGDNLEALKALLPFYAGRVKCIFIDPPYNTKSAFTHYDDNLEHSQWLSMMYPRLELLRQLLSDDGSIWITIDDNEQPYLRTLMDEIFGRANFIATAIWQKVFAPKNTARHFSEDHDYVLVFAKDSNRWVPNPMERTEKQDRAYKNPDNDPRGPWKPGDVAARNFYSKGTYAIRCPGGRLIEGPRPGTFWRLSEERFWELDRDNRIWWGSDKNRLPMIKRFKTEVMAGRVPQTLWMYDEVGHTKEAKEEVNAVVPSGEAVFQTPKPERLLKRTLGIATKPGDIVLDSFLGSGTTAAVAHKMGRRWIGIEMGEHARTHCLPRLRKVIEGEQGGISESVGWKGGGGFRFLQLGSHVFGEDGRLNADIRFDDLAAYLWFLETRTPHERGQIRSPVLGIHDGSAVVLLYNGILGDKRPTGGNVLTSAILSQLLRELPAGRQRTVIYGEACRLSDTRLRAAGITFKQIPYDLPAR